jgi:hypothetical protein
MIVVAGITRSGLSLTMQMLHAGGYPCAGEFPAFECFDIGQIPWGDLQGKAVKAVDTQLQNPPSGPCSVIRLRRNLVEQCKSINKWNNAFGIPSADEKRIHASLVRDYRTIDAWAADKNCLTLDFEQLIQHPRTAAQRIAEFVKDVQLDVDAMGSAVIKRTTACFDGLLELQLLGK